jgi:hypothetical protein
MRLNHALILLLLASPLLAQAPNDAVSAAASHCDRSAIEELKSWNELYDAAEDAVRFPRHQNDVTFNAFRTAASDPRGRALALRALASGDLDLIPEAIHGLALQHDDASLALIAKTLDRFPHEAASLAFSLYAFRSEAADALAARYLSSQDLSDFRQAQNEGLQ